MDDKERFLRTFIDGHLAAANLNTFHVYGRDIIRFAQIPDRDPAMQQAALDAIGIGKTATQTVANISFDVGQVITKTALKVLEKDGKISAAIFRAHQLIVFFNALKGVTITPAPARPDGAPVAVAG